MAETKTTDETTRSIDGTEVVRLATSGANWKATLAAIKTYSAPVGANPTASVGLTAVNGSALTFMRSDAAPALDQTPAYAFSGLGATTISQQGASASALTLTGGTVTTSQPLINATQTWNAGAVAFSALKINVTNTASASSSGVAEFQVGGFPLVRFATNAQLQFFDSTSTTIQGRITGADSAGAITIFASSTRAMQIDGDAKIAATGRFAWSPTGDTRTSGDLFLSRGAAATLQLGAANAASPVAQTLQTQGSRAGTDSNVSGAPLTIASGQGTGNSTGSSLIFQTPFAVASGTSAQTMTTALTLNGSQQAVFSAGSASTPSIISTVETGTGLFFAAGNINAVINGSATVRFKITANGISTGSGPSLGSLPAGSFEIAGQGLFSNTGKADVVLNSAGTNYGFIQNDAADTWSLATGTTLNSLGAPVLSWVKGGTVTIGSAAGVASPAARILNAEGSRAGTDSNIGGANLTITSGLGTGTGTRSVLTLKTPIVTTSGSGAQTQTTGLRVDNGTAVLTAYTVSTLPTSPLAGSLAYVTDALAPTFLATVVGGGAVVTPIFYNGTNWVGV